MIRKKAFLLFYLTIHISNSYGNILEINDSIYSSVIERDQWGVPHIYGNRDSDVAFGLAYAHSQDDFKSIQDIILASRGMLASVYGKEAAVNDITNPIPLFMQRICKGDSIPDSFLIRITSIPKHNAATNAIRAPN